MTCIALGLLTTYELELHVKIGAGVSHVLMGTLFLIVKPYKTKWMNRVDGLVLTVIGLLILMTMFDGKTLDVMAIVLVIALSLIGLMGIKCKQKLCII